MDLLSSQGDKNLWYLLFDQSNCSQYIMRKSLEFGIAISDKASEQIYLLEDAPSISQQPPVGR